LHRTAAHHKCSIVNTIARFSHSYSGLPERFFAHQPPTPVANPALVMFNDSLAAELGLDAAAIAAAGPELLFSGNAIPPGAAPIAMAYAGHQFGNFVPQLGDGRAILLGEVLDASGQLRDIQLKGAGRTPFSRGGDGRAALGPVLREYLLSEAMHALGIPTTRALAAVTTGEVVRRETALPGAVFTRVLASNIRVGTFQFFAARGDVDGVKNLADYVIARHYPELAQQDAPYLALLKSVMQRQAALISSWLQIGFIHGVMNTDNMALSGETIDYGPCAFMDRYDPAAVFSSIDYAGRYAFGNQPSIAQWNLARLAETLLPLIDDDEPRSIELATGILKKFPEEHRRHWLAGMRAKLGLHAEEDGDPALINHLLQLMQAQELDYTQTFRNLSDGAIPEPLAAWAETWRERLARDRPDMAAAFAAMRKINPVYIPRNHMVDQALTAAVAHGDFGPFHELCEVLQHPFDERPEFARYAAPPAPGQAIIQTFCGT
jgi:uncharacterized protein YdiU (UPF0061 family)